MKLNWLVLILVFFTSAISDCCINVPEGFDSLEMISSSSECTDHEGHTEKNALVLDCCQISCALKITIPRLTLNHILVFTKSIGFNEVYQSFDPIDLDPLLDPPIRFS